VELKIPESENFMTTQITVFCLVLFLSGQSGYTKTIDLNELRFLGQKNNYLVNAARVDTELSLKDESIAKSSFLPQIGIKGSLEQLNVNGTISSEQTNTLYGQVNIFNGFRDHNNLNIKKLESQKSVSHLKESKFNLNLRLETLYYSYLYLSKNLDITSLAVKRNKKHLRLIRKRLSSSLITKTDLLEFELRRSKLLSKEHFLQLKMIEIKEQLFLTAGIENSRDLEIIGVLPHFEMNISLADLLKKISSSSEVLKRLKIALAQSDSEISMSNSNWFPSVDFEAKYGDLSTEVIGIDSNEAASQLSVMFKWEIYSGGKTTNEKDKSYLKKKKNEFLLKQRMLDITSVIKTNYYRLIALQDRIESEEINEKIAIELYSKTKNEYKKGIKDSGALSSAGDELTSINETIYELKKNYINAKLNMESALGQSIEFKQITHK
jgi:outer membrane protein TolC